MTASLDIARGSPHAELRRIDVTV